MIFGIQVLALTSRALQFDHSTDGWELGQALYVKDSGHHETPCADATALWGSPGHCISDKQVTDLGSP